MVRRWLDGLSAVVEGGEGQRWRGETSADVARRRITEGKGAPVRTCGRSGGNRSRRGMPTQLSTFAAETNDLSKSLANGLIWAWLQVYEICLYPEFSWLMSDRNWMVQISDRKEKSFYPTLEDLVLCL
jgi:hypothetical protein